MENIISSITPLYPPNHEFITETALSVLELENPEGYEIEWLIQVDGSVDERLENKLQAIEDLFKEHDDKDVFIESHTYNAGAAASRNLAASRARGKYLKMLDADDMLDPKCLVKDLSAVSNGDNNVKFVFTMSKDIVLNEANEWEYVEFFLDDLSDWKQGVVSGAFFIKNFVDKTMPFPAAPVFVETETFWRVGGYSAIASSEDTNLLIKLARDGDGYFINEQLYTYRKWNKQHTTEEVFLNERLYDQRRRLNFKYANVDMRFL